MDNSNDDLTGTAQDDAIVGTAGEDVISAGGGDDHVVAGGGDDYVEGGDGQDVLIGDTPTAYSFDPAVIHVVESYEMTMTFEYEGAGYRNSIGMYRIDPETGEISDVEIAWENASLAGSGGDLEGGVSSVTFDLQAGDQVGFFLIGNGFSLNDFGSLTGGSYEFVNDDGEPATVLGGAPTLRHVADDGSVTQLNGHIFHSATTETTADINSDGLSHTEGTASSEIGTFQLGFEDIHGGGDLDFNDAVITVDIGHINGAALLDEAGDPEEGGNDRLEGRSGEDLIEGNGGNDLLVGGGASTEWTLVNGEWVYDGSQLDSSDPNIGIAGEDDVIVGGHGNDVLLGNGGNDTLYGNQGDDRFNGGHGDDRAFGGSGADRINLQRGNDYAEGGSGADIINAGSGDDVVYGDQTQENLLYSGGSETSFGQFATHDAWQMHTDEATGMSQISQEIMTEEGEPYSLTFDLAANLAAGSTSGSIEVLLNGTVIDTIDTSSGLFESHTVNFTGTGGLGNLSFRQIMTSDEAASAAPEYTESDGVLHYSKTVTLDGQDVDVSAFAPGQSNLYQVISGQFKVFDTETSEYQDVGDGFGFKVNAIGFNVEDDLVYGIAKGDGFDALGNPIEKSDLVMIDATGNAYRVGDTPVYDYVGDFDDQGNLWTFDSSVNRITKIDVDNVDASGNMVVENHYLPADFFGGRTYDITFNAQENAFYALEAPALVGGEGTIHKIDMTGFDGTNTPTITSIPVNATLFEGAMLEGMAKGAYGAMFIDADGNIFAGLNRGDHDLDGSTDAAGALYKFNIDWENGAAYAEYLSDSQTTGSNDGASDPRALDPFAESEPEATILLRSPQLEFDGGGDDRLRGGHGNDEMHGGGGADILHGHSGDDTLFGDSGDDKVFGGAGDDVMSGGTGADLMKGGSGDDDMSGDDGNDRLRGGNGSDTLSGGTGNDRLAGDDGDDALSGGAGHDQLYGNTGNDIIDGGNGDDRIGGGTGGDVIDGGAGNDKIVGEAGNDTIFGGAGADKLVGGSGSDVIEGGAGNDHLWGGNWTGDNASDTFAYSHGGGRDMIHDFEAEHDQIDLSAYGMSYEDLQDRIIDRGWATEINLEGIDKSGAGDKILIKSIKPDDLDSDNFIM